MKHTKIFNILLLTIIISLSACEKNYPLKFAALTVNLSALTGIQDYSLSHLKLTFTEANTGLVTQASLLANGTLDKELQTGSYSVSLTGDIAYAQNNTAIQSKIKSYKDGIAIQGDAVRLSLDIFLADENAGFIFKEIFFTGTQTPENKTYQGDKYFIIYNNAEDTLYADGLLLAQSSFNTTTIRTYTPDVMNEAFTSAEIVMIPGKGKDYPVAPGAQIMVANNAINHLESNANSFDLRKADFEINLIAALNVDNPEVTNTISVAGSMTMHNSGFTSYVLGRLPQGMTVDDFKTQNLYTYEYNNGGRIVSTNAYKIPNTYILDAVNLSAKSGFQWILTAPNLDMGWSYCTLASGDVSRFKKTVLRKVLTTNPDGRIIYQDTNNSTADFIPASTPSILH